ncbi:MAG: hypothetical protein Q8M03_13710 [Legionella sp.]|nr:hypothetical protein [Legionella sp.]
MPDKKAVTSIESTRLLPLDGKDGTVFCRVHSSLLNSRIPRRSPNGTIEASVRSRARLDNLRAVRGVPGKSMVGPADYYGNWEAAHQYSFSVDINKGVPIIYQHEREASQLEQKAEIPEDMVTSVKGVWTSGADSEAIKAKREEYASQDHPLTGDSLFKSSGLLEIAGDSVQIELYHFDASEVDLSYFKSRLVKNDEPFTITSKPVPVADEWRAVSYRYEPEYAKRVVDEGGGLFLETHDFAQSITPLDEKATGFVTLGRWKDDSKRDELELIGVRIPFGYTLIIEEGCIHGDSDLNGMFMMCMTSNHVTMSSADTVFLKHAATKKNLSIELVGMPVVLEDIPEEDDAPAPLVIYNGQEDWTELDAITKNMDVMFNPLSNGWWKKVMHDMREMAFAFCNAFTAAIVALIDGVKSTCSQFASSCCFFAGGRESGAPDDFYRNQLLVIM